MNKKTNVYAIIPAAGQGSRMGSPKTNKQFLELQGIPVLARTLLMFENSKDVDGIIVVTGQSDEPRIKEICLSYGIRKLIGIAKGGDTRQDSVRNALQFLEFIISGEEPGFSGTDNYVLIHDGARPFVSNEIIDRCICGAKKYLACGAGVRVKDTIKQVNHEGRIINTPPRDELFAIQTPQAFLLPLISDLHAKAYRENLRFTDDTAIAEHYGTDVYMITGEYRNIKITTPEDLLYGEILLKDYGQK